VESLADMTPEELEAIPGIDAEVVDRISVAVNNYFSTLEAAQAAEAAAAEVAAAEAAKALEAEAESTEAPAEGETVAAVPATAVADAEPPVGAEVATEGEAEAVKPTEEEETSGNK